MVRRTDMFSPILATRWVSVWATSFAPMFLLSSFSRSPSSSSASFAAVFTKSLNSSLRATKSVSAFTSTSAPTLPPVATPTRPSAAARPDFLAALVMPFLRSQSCAASMSPPVSASADLQSIMPAPVLSRSSFTMLAVTAVIGDSVSVRFNEAAVQRCLALNRRIANVRPWLPRPGLPPLASGPESLPRRRRRCRSRPGLGSDRR